jgi:ABC-2 type transport system ATP-binding protein
VAILKKGALLTTGAVEDVLVDEDVVEISAANPAALLTLMQQWGTAQSVSLLDNRVLLAYPKGTARPEDINRYCFAQGIALNHITIKRKRLEAKFFELTNN